MKQNLFVRLLPLLCGMLLTLVGIPSVLAGDFDGKLAVHILDVGQGDAMLIRSPTGKNVLIDAGDVKPADRMLQRIQELVPGPLDMVVMSHPHADHIGGMAKVLRKKGAKLFLDPGFDHASKIYADVTTALEELAIPVRLAQAGRKIDIGGGAVLEILSPALPYFKNTRSDVNANSVVARLTYGSISFFFAADSEDETEKGILKRIVQEQGRSITSTVYKVAHHGSKHASSTELLDEIQPKYAVFSVGAENRYGHPSPEALDRVIKTGAKIYRTDENGEVIFVTDGKKMVVKTERGGASKTLPVFEQEDPDAGRTFVASKKGKTFHIGTCRFGKKISPKNKVKYATLKEASASGKTPAKCCLRSDGTPKGGKSEDAGSGDESHHSDVRASGTKSSNFDADSMGLDEEPELPADEYPKARKRSADRFAAGDESSEVASSGGFIASKNSKKFHKGTCKNGLKIKESNKVMFKTRDAAIASGRTPAADCKP